MVQISGKGRLILRFSVNRKGAAPAGDWSKRMKTGVRVLIPEMLVNYADKTYTRLSESIRASVKRDAEAEIRNIARRYSRMIIGANRGGPAHSQLESRATGPGRPSQGGVSLPAWPARTPKYMAWKQREGLSPNFFLAQTHTLRATMGRGAVWQEIFGPVRVTVLRKATASKGNSGASKAIKKLSESSLGNIDHKADRVGLLQVKVEAFGHVRSSMLRNFTSHGGLIGLVAQYDQGLAYRLGGPYPDKHRPTLQPFIEFVLARAIPYAVSQRITKGLGSSIIQTRAER